MKLKKSPKIFNNYKCDYPENTIKRIKRGFEKIGLSINYKEKKIEWGNFSYFTGKAIISNTNFLAGGRGITFQLGKASAFGQMAERFSAGLMFLGYPLPGLNHEALFWEKFPKSDFRGTFYNFTHLKGYIDSSKVSLKEYVPIEDFFIKKVNLSSNELNEIKQSDLLTHWVDAYSLTNKKHKKIPLKFVRKISGTNGLAAGNTIEEAVVQGICEIFERYSALKIIKNKTEVPTINIDSIKDKTLLSYINFFRSQNFDIFIKDFSFGNVLPCIGVLFINNNLKNTANQLKKDLYFKKIHVGAHPDKTQALLRCFTEELEGLNIEELVSRDSQNIFWNSWILKMKKKYFPLKDDYYFLLKNYLVGDNLSFLEKGKIISFDGLFNEKNGDCLKEIEKLINICDTQNWEVLVVDQTHPLIKFPTVRVIIPPLSAFFVDMISDFNLKITDYRAWEETIYHGFRNISYYIRSDDWLKSKEKIKRLINDLEDYLSRHLFSSTLFINYNPLFLWELLAVANLSIGKHKEALNCLEVLEKTTNVDLRTKCDRAFNKNLFRNRCDDCTRSCEKNFYKKMELMMKSFF